MKNDQRVDPVGVLYTIRNLLLAMVLVATMACVYLYLFHMTPFLNIIEQSLVPDGKIDNRLRAISMIFSALLLTIVILTLGIRRSVLAQFVAAWDTGDTNTINKGLGIVSLTLVAIHLIDTLPWINLKIYLGEDGVFEMATALFAFLAGAIMLYVCFRQTRWRARLLMCTVGISFLLFAMEEISWGQRIVGWNTPDWLNQINNQGETTIHNLASHSLLNQLQATFLLICAATLFLLGRYSQELVGRFDLNDVAHLLPDSGLSILAWVLLFCVPYTLINGGELSEEIIAVFGLAYAINQLATLGAKGGQMSSQTTWVNS